MALAMRFSRSTVAGSIVGDSSTVIFGIKEHLQRWDEAFRGMFNIAYMYNIASTHLPVRGGAHRPTDSTLYTIELVSVIGGMFACSILASVILLTFLPSWTSPLNCHRLTSFFVS